jgi:hypothetical protein
VLQDTEDIGTVPNIRKWFNSDQYPNDRLLEVEPTSRITLDQVASHIWTSQSAVEIDEEWGQPTRQDLPLHIQAVAISH